MGAGSGSHIAEILAADFGRAPLAARRLRDSVYGTPLLICGLCGPVGLRCERAMIGGCLQLQGAVVARRLQVAQERYAQVQRMLDEGRRSTGVQGGVQGVLQNEIGRLNQIKQLAAAGR
jgi:hypothetical protein